MAGLLTGVGYAGPVIPLGGRQLNNFFADKDKMSLLGLLGSGMSGMGGGGFGGLSGGGLGAGLGLLPLLMQQKGGNPLEGTGINPAIFGGGLLSLLGK